MRTIKFISQLHAEVIAPSLAHYLYVIQTKDVEMILQFSNNSEYELNGTCKELNKLGEDIKNGINFFALPEQKSNPKYYDAYAKSISIKSNDEKLTFSICGDSFIISGQESSIDVFVQNLLSLNFEGHFHFDWISRENEIEEGNELVIASSFE